MSSNKQILWKRPQGCTCDYSENENLETNEFSLVRVIDPLCPLHGQAADSVDEAVKVAIELMKTTPGGRNLNEANLRRIFKVVSPILKGESSTPTTS